MGSSSGRSTSTRAKGRTRGAANPVGKGHDAPRYEQGRRGSDTVAGGDKNKRKSKPSRG